jgi:hypothetical protein
MKQSARIHIAKSGSLAVVVTMHVNEDGIWYESESPAVLRGPLTAEQLGGAVVRAMSATAQRSKDLRTVKMSDWPSYRASGATSVRNFEQEFISLAIDGANDANLVAVVTGAPEIDAELQVTSSVSTAFPTSMGECILRVYEACRDRRL